MRKARAGRVWPTVLLSLVATVGFALPGRAKRPKDRKLTLRAALDVGAGFDGNVYWTFDEDPAHQAPPGQALGLPPAVSDAMVLQRPKLKLDLWPTSRHLVGLLWESDLRQYIEQGWTQLHQIQLSYHVRFFKQAFVQASMRGQGFWRQRYEAERYMNLEAHLGFLWALPFSYHFAAGYLFEGRRYPDAHREEDEEIQNDLSHGVYINGSYRIHPRLELGARYSFLHVDSSKEFHDHKSHRFSAEIKVLLPYRIRVLVEAGGQVHLLDRYHAPAGGQPSSRRDLLAYSGAEVRYHPLGWLSIWGGYTYHFSTIRWQEIRWTSDRHQVAFGVGVHWELIRSSKPSEGVLVRPVGWSKGAGRDGRASRTRGRWVTFHLKSKMASRAAVIGSFNGWDATRGKMTRIARHRFRASFFIASGRHIYTFEVDGRPLSRPPGARAYVSDGFGGQNGVIEVP